MAFLGITDQGGEGGEGHHAWLFLVLQVQTFTRINYNGVCREFHFSVTAVTHQKICLPGGCKRYTSLQGADKTHPFYTGNSRADYFLSVMKFNNHCNDFIMPHQTYIPTVPIINSGIT